MRLTLKNISYFTEVTDIYLFDSKGYEKSMAFDHSLIEKIKINKLLMIAGNIQVNDNLDNYKKIADIIDISGGLETSGIKDKSKINIFLNKVEQVKNET
jgi:phosphoribosylanthranilate isomerase